MNVSESAASPTPVNEEIVRLIRQALSHLDAADSVARSDHEDTEESSYWQRQKMELLLAQADFAAALDLAPDEPWILFQIGWIQFKLWGLPPREVIETARAIFERVLEIENDNVCARFALASLTLVFGPCSFDQEYDEIERTPLPFLSVGARGTLRLTPGTFRVRCGDAGFRCQVQSAFGRVSGAQVGVCLERTSG